MPARKLKEFLDAHSIRYVTIHHSPAYTAAEVAASAHVAGDELAKTVMVRLDGELAMAVLPASFKVDFDQLREVSGARSAVLASESEFAQHFPDCTVGAMPPFGNLYDLPVYVAETLRDNEEIAFNAGSLTELIRMRYEDFERLVQPTPLRFTVHV